MTTMTTRQAGRPLLVAVSAAQLAAGVAGHVLAVRQGRAFDIAILHWRGRPERIARDSWLLGTGLSAPVALLAVQATLTSVLAARPSEAVHRALGVLGAAMSSGYLVEREFRAALTPNGAHPAATPIAVLGFGLALATAALGLSPAHLCPPDRER